MHIVRKAFWNFEKEEKWLNDMSAKGLALTDYSCCRYVFSETPRNQYTYRIELLDNLPTHVESVTYLKFLEENGVECVATYVRWVYLRKKSSDGQFDIYSDLKSRVNHYKKIKVLWNSVMWAEFMLGFVNLAIGVVNLLSSNKLGNFTWSNLIIGGGLISLSILLGRLGSPIRKKIKDLEQEIVIRE